MRNSMTRNVTLLLALVLLLVVPCALGEAVPEEVARELPIGDSGYSIVVPAGFVLGDMTDADLLQREHAAGLRRLRRTQPGRPEPGGLHRGLRLRRRHRVRDR